METESSYMTAEGRWECVGKPVAIQGHRASLGGDNVLKLECGDGCITLKILKPSEWSTLRVNCMVCELYIKKDLILYGSLLLTE